VGLDPAAIAVMPDESAALVTNFGSGTVSVISPTQQIAIIPMPGGSPDGIAITPDSQRAYVTNFDNIAPAVYAIDIPSRQVIATMPADPFPAVVAITPDGSQAWVTSIFGNSVEIIDTLTNTVIKDLEGIPGAWGMTFNPTGTRAYVVGSTTGNVYVIDTTTYRFVATIPVGPTPRHAICSGRFVFVTNTKADYITQIDTISNTVVQNITVGQAPVGIGWVNTGSQPAPLVVPGEAK
jgi:YVTN family beta-propeller protein